LFIEINVLLKASGTLSPEAFTGSFRVAGLIFVSRWSFLSGQQ